MGTTQVEPSGGVDPSVPSPEGPDDGPDTESVLTEDELFEMLSNQRRRYILHELMRRGESIQIGELSQEIAAHEDGLSIEEVTSSDRKRVYTALHQSHLPKLDNAGVVDFDRDRGTVEPTSTLEDVEIYMDVVRGRDVPWSDYYLGLTGIAAVALALSALGLGPFAAVSAYAWGAFVVVSFGVSALAHRYYARQNRLGIEETPPTADVSTANE